MSGTEQLELYLQDQNGKQFTDTPNASWSSSNTQVATVDANGVVTGVAGGSVTIAAFDDNAPVYGHYCNPSYPVACPVFTGLGGSAGGTVQVPTYFFSPSATQTSTPPVCTQEGATGYFIDVSYYVADANSNRVSQPGMAPGENMGDGNGWHNAFATPTTTGSNGNFDDKPNGSCYITSGHFCANAPGQSFHLIDNSIVFPIATNTTRKTCTDGIQVIIQGNPASQNKTYTFGNTQ